MSNPQRDLFSTNSVGEAVAPPRPPVRETSAVAYREAVSDGTVGVQAHAVLELLRSTGRALTGREIDQALAQPGDSAASYHKRLSELARLHLVVEAERRPCTISGKGAIAWRAA